MLCSIKCGQFSWDTDYASRIFRFLFQKDDLIGKNLFGRVLKLHLQTERRCWWSCCWNHPTIGLGKISRLWLEKMCETIEPNSKKSTVVKKSLIGYILYLFYKFICFLNVFIISRFLVFEPFCFVDYFFSFHSFLI